MEARWSTSVLFLTLQLFVPLVSLRAQEPNSLPSETTPKKTENSVEPEEKEKAKKSSGWGGQFHIGGWYHTDEVKRGTRQYSESGFLSLSLGGAVEYRYDPLYLSIGADLYTPQILWKSIGLGIYYFVCYAVTIGKCNSNAKFGTGPNDAGAFTFSTALGFFREGIPVRFYVGPDFGTIYSGLTSGPFGALFLKGGIEVNFVRFMGIDFSMRRAIPSDEKNPSFWFYSLSLVTRFGT
jgi:hypothetical protein